MKNLVIILSMFILNTGYAQTTTKNQNSRFIDFINSFEEEEKSDEVLIFTELIQNAKPMSKNEALSFVYNTEDTTALYCTEYSISQDTEEVMGINTYLYLPDKYFRIEKGNYFLIVSSSYKCGGRHGITTKFLHLLIVDKNYNIIDKLMVCNCDWDNCSIVGLLNSKRDKIFLLHKFADWDKQHETHKAYMYEVDETTLKFQLINEGDVEKNVSTTNLQKVLNGLNWQGVFLE